MRFYTTVSAPEEAGASRCKSAYSRAQARLRVPQSEVSTPLTKGHSSCMNFQTKLKIESNSNCNRAITLKPTLYFLPLTVQLGQPAEFGPFAAFFFRVFREP